MASNNRGLLGGLNELTSNIRKATTTVQQSVNGVNSAARSVTSTLNSANRTKESVKELGQRAKGDNKKAAKQAIKAEENQRKTSEGTSEMAHSEEKNYYIKDGVKYTLRKGERPPVEVSAAPVSAAADTVNSKMTAEEEEKLPVEAVAPTAKPFVRTHKYYCVFCGKQYDVQEDGKCPYCCAPGEDR